MRLVQILAGATLALVVAVTVASLVLAFAVWTIHHDASVVKAFEAGNLLAPVRRMLAHGREPGQGVPVAIALGAGSAAGIGFIVLLLTGRDGGARFQSRADLAAGGYLRANTMFVGRIGGLSLAWRAWKRDPDTKVLEQSVRRRLVGGTPVHMPDFGHALVSGPTRSGKGASLIIPNALEFPGSMVILDIRGETFERTAGWRARFSKVIKIAPSSLISHCYNPLDFVRRRPGFFEGDIMSIAGGLISSSTADKYWAKDAIELVAGVIGYVLEADGEPDKHLGAVMDVLVGRDNAQDRLREIIARHAATLSGFTLSKIVPFATMAEKQWNGVYGMVRTSLSPFNNATTRKVLSRSSFDLFAVRRTAHTLYVDFRLSQLSAMGSLCNVLVTQIMNHLTDDLRADGEHRVLFMLDEFTTLGEIAPLMGLLKVGAGNGVGVWAFVQSMTNVEEIYGKTGLDNFLDNIEAFIFLGGSSTSVLDHVERRLGKRVVHQKIRRRQAGGGRSISAGTSTEERPVEKSLMSIDELTRLDRRVAIVLPRGAGPIRLWRNSNADCRRRIWPRRPGRRPRTRFDPWRPGRGRRRSSTPVSMPGDRRPPTTAPLPVDASSPLPRSLRAGRRTGLGRRKTGSWRSRRSWPRRQRFLWPRLRRLKFPRPGSSAQRSAVCLSGRSGRPTSPAPSPRQSAARCSAICSPAASTIPGSPLPSRRGR
jgi:type IV secretory pathway TraG/TraD family ATPase VirD4